MIFRKWEGGQRLLGTFLKIHLFWRLSLLSDFYSVKDSSSHGPETNKSPPTPDSFYQIVSFLTRHSLSFHFCHLWCKQVQQFHFCQTPFLDTTPFRGKSTHINSLIMNALTFPLDVVDGLMKKNVLARTFSVVKFFQFHEESHATVVLLVSEWILIGTSTLSCVSRMKTFWIETKKHRKPLHMRLFWICLSFM